MEVPTKDRQNATKHHLKHLQNPVPMHLRNTKMYAAAPEEHRQQTMDLIGTNRAKVLNTLIENPAKRLWHDVLEAGHNGDQFRDPDEVHEQHVSVAEINQGHKLHDRSREREELHKAAMWKGTKYMFMGVPTIGSFLGGGMYLAHKSNRFVRALPLNMKLLPVIITTFVASHAYADRKMMHFTEKFGFHKKGNAMREAKLAGERGHAFNWFPPLVGGLAATGMALVAQRTARPAIAGDFGTRFTPSQRLMSWRIGGQAMAIGAITSFALFVLAHRENSIVHKLFPSTPIWNRATNQPRLLLAKETGYDEDRSDYKKKER